MSRIRLEAYNLESVHIHSHISITSEGWLQGEMCVISINGAEEEDKGEGEERKGGWWATRLPGLWVPKDVEEGKAALNMQQCKLGCEERGRRGGGSEPLAPSPFQTVSPPRAVAASLFCGQLVLTFPHSLQYDIFCWPFLCCLTSITLAFLASHSPRSCWEPVSFWLAASVISAFCHPPTGPHTGTNTFKST